MAASTAPTVKAALLTLLRADSGLTGVQIDYSDPGANIGQEELFFGRTIATEAPSSMGQRRQYEKYDIEIYIYVKQDGDDPQTCEERCYAIVGRLEAVVRANNTNAGALSTAMVNAAGFVHMGSYEITPFTVPGARVTEAVCKVHAEAVK